MIYVTTAKPRRTRRGHTIPGSDNLIITYPMYKVSTQKTYSYMHFPGSNRAEVVITQNEAGGEIAPPGGRATHTHTERMRECVRVKE